MAEAVDRHRARVFPALAIRRTVVEQATRLRRLVVTTANPYDQTTSRVRFGWGPEGLAILAPTVDVCVVIDVLSFTTSVDIALGRGAVIFPYRWHDGSEFTFADSVGAEVASCDGESHGWSLRPASLVDVPAGLRLVLPSPNGSTLSFGAAEAGASTVVAACLRNGAAVGSVYADEDVTVAVIAGGERWGGTSGPMRVAVEDLYGAGAVLSMFDSDDLSPEASTAVAAWRDAEPDIVDRLRGCASGREKIVGGFPEDVDLAAQAHVSESVPTLDGDHFVAGPI